jgi:hypothetical protein
LCRCSRFLQRGLGRQVCRPCDRTLVHRRLRRSWRRRCGACRRESRICKRRRPEDRKERRRRRLSRWTVCVLRGRDV